MPLYLDSSVLVALIEDEPTRPLCEHFLIPGQDIILVSDFTMAETSGALVALWRADRRPTQLAVTELARLDLWTDDFTSRVHVDRADMTSATEFVRRPGLVLRGPDAIHIAATDRLGATLLTLDRGMARAASSLGVACINPAEPSAN